ncbi:hypothetical protein E3U55_12725 [Filobacillus milosensis]|uniref:Uncharacterized protein n=1 Tax=Filobacillus milosensis TaxID=94137 RepID=A0A4Y8IEY5_9BACI|nr:hypothetical protein [Filobacillus milosensis]TFB15110.1 hypothetical protein E3U55_12725 [Filobacillus milosensis]
MKSLFFIVLGVVAGVITTILLLNYLGQKSIEDATNYSQDLPNVVETSNQKSSKEIIQNDTEEAEEEEADTGEDKDESTSSNQEEKSQLTDEQIILELSEQIVNALHNSDMNTLASFVHGTEGLLFSPYIYIQPNSQQFNQGDIPTLLNNTNIYNWGTEDGTGNPIDLTPQDYFSRYVYNKNYSNPDEIKYDEYIERSSMINNISTYFNNVHVVEYYVEGQMDLDWGSLNLVFKQDNNGDWKLIAIVHDEWTT